MVRALVDYQFDRPQLYAQQCVFRQAVLIARALHHIPYDNCACIHQESRRYAALRVHDKSHRRTLGLRRRRALKSLTLERPARARPWRRGSPGPIPNPAVKPALAESTTEVSPWEDRAPRSCRALKRWVLIGCLRDSLSGSFVFLSSAVLALQKGKWYCLSNARGADNIPMGSYNNCF